MPNLPLNLADAQQSPINLSFQILCRMQTEILKLTGMTSDACGETVKRALQTLDGVSSVSVSVTCNQAVVKFDESQLAKPQLHAAIKQAGYGVVAVRAVDLSGNFSGGCGGSGCSCG